MSDEKPGSPSKLSKLLEGTYNITDREKFLVERGSLLYTIGVSSMSGKIDQAGPVSDGTFSVVFDNGTTGYATHWPQWAYEAARQALLHGKKVLVSYTGDAPYGSNLTGVFILNTPA